jgi:hypothetical protein
MENLNYKEILVKKPWFEIQPNGYLNHGSFGRWQVQEGNDVNIPSDKLVMLVKTQADFLREYYPSAHRIFDENEYPDIWKMNPDYDPENPGSGKKWYLQPITRTAFAFQQVIATKHILHVIGNDIQFELLEGGDSADKSDELKRNLAVFKRNWLSAGMETVMYDAIRSYMITGDCAIVGYFSEGKFGARALSYLNGDTLYPHFNSITGELELFARQYRDFGDDGKTKCQWVEVWDNKYLYRFKDETVDEGRSIASKIIDKIKNVFGISGYHFVSKQEHGYQFVPVSYARNNDGPCWAAVQRNIEDYEESFSYLCENNKAYAFPIFYVKGDGEDITIKGDDMTGAVKSIAMSGEKNEAGFLNGTDASNAFATQLDKSYNLIYELSFTVKPPELKSGDLPGVALKLLYSPAIEAASNDAERLHPFLSSVVKIAKYGIGVQEDMIATMTSLPINAWIEPYVHQNKTEIITNIATAVQNKFISKQTASERCPDFPMPDEFDRIMREEKEAQQQDLLMDIARADNELENNIEEEEAVARINKGQSGQDVNTGKSGSGRKRGRPNRSGKAWDENGNFLGESNWDSYNRTK